MFKRLCLGISLLSLVSFSSAAPQDLWIKQFGASGGDAAASITTDSKGNIYVAGWTDGALPGRVNLDPSNAFIKKYDTNGKEIWIKQFGASGLDVAFSITTDSKGNIYVAGDTSETLFSNLDSGDAFVRKYNSNGKEIWARQFGSNKWDNASSVATDAKGNIYIAGWTDGTFPGQTKLGGLDAFIKKYDTNGKEIWIKQFGTSGDDVAFSIATDPKRNIYIAGRTDGTLPGEVNLGSGDAFVRKYDTNGKEIWIKQFGTNGDDVAFSVATDSEGNIYVAGRTDGTLPGEVNLDPSNAFVRKYDTNGKEIWIKQFGTSGDDVAFSVATDPKRNIYVAGRTAGELPGQTKLGGFDAFIRKYDTNGKEIWIKQFGTSGDEVAFSVVTDPKRNIYIAGRTDGTLSGQTNLGGSDAFLYKIAP